MEDKLTIQKLRMMTPSQLKELREKYNHTDNEFILFCIDWHLDNIM